MGYVSRSSLRLTATFGEKFSEASRIATKSHLHHDEGDRQGNPELISEKKPMASSPRFFPGKFQETWQMFFSMAMMFSLQDCIYAQ